MDDKAKSPDPDDLTGDTSPTRPMSPDELSKFEEEIIQGQEEPDEDLPQVPPDSSADAD